MIQDGIYGILEEDYPQTVRGVFYQAVSKGLIRKTQAEYKTTICRLLTNMRKNGSIPYHWLSDSTRWMRKPTTYDSLEGAMYEMWKYYRRSIWNELPVYVEIWMEKDALAGVVYEITEKYDVPLMVTRGYPSLSFLHSAGESIREQERPTYLYYFGDYDPSGIDIAKNVEKGLRDFAFNSEIHFLRIAVTPYMIESWNLPSRPTKKSDTRAKNFKGESVELDSIPAKWLRLLVEHVIKLHIPDETLEGVKLVEDAEKATLRNILRGL
jgi:hypothetical protein